MKRIRITHKTEYHYSQPVRFGPHRAMMRPRDGHDLRIVRAHVEIVPDALVRWKRDIYGNSIAVLTFDAPAPMLRILAEMDVDLHRYEPNECLIEPGAASFPFQYAPEEQIELVPYRLPSYPYDGPALQDWLRAIYRPGQAIGTFDLLVALNNHVHDSIRYQHRDEPGVQLPHTTLQLRTGSCRDYAVLMMEAARHLGFGARFVSGYIQMQEGQHGATHAWVEVYIPGSGWCGFDPTNRKLAAGEHVSVAVAREQEKAAPLSGSWSGPADAFSRMEVLVQVVPL